jgi:hypothetical protein
MVRSDIHISPSTSVDNYGTNSDSSSRNFSQRSTYVNPVALCMVDSAEILSGQDGSQRQHGCFGVH